MDAESENYYKSLAWKKLRGSVLCRDEFVCAYCGGEATTADHVTPRKRGGPDHPDNLVACCQGCNGALSDGVFTSFYSKKKWFEDTKYARFLNRQNAHRLQSLQEMMQDSSESGKPPSKDNVAFSRRILIREGRLANTAPHNREFWCRLCFASTTKDDGWRSKNLCPSCYEVVEEELGIQIVK